MNRKYLPALTLALAALAAGNALASDAGAPKTTGQVRAELLEAQRTGDIVADGNSGQKLNELYPSQYPAKAAAQGNTRAQVLAELAQAQRTGDIAVHGESGQKLNELNPGHYPAQAATQGNTRAQVLAELAQAQRSGGLAYGDNHSSH
ncbi:MAG: DUF4148 domain-containing protein [Lacisediminimonas sp.]|nr:DUF4148 domain-containing protein [Lacisediminimonas sp.]